MDGVTLAVARLQSTSDQQDPLSYSPIAAAATTVVPSEQGAVWACPQPEYDDGLITWTLGWALLGRIHLSGHLDRMPDRRRALVRDAVDIYKSIRGDLAGALSFRPLGLPGWTDEWLAPGLRTPGDATAYLSVWRRGGPARLRIPLRHPAGGALRVDVPHPSAPDAGGAVWDGEGPTVFQPRTPGVLLIRLGQEP
ncbi:hypothetical protein AB0D89_36140 [Streptomyces luteogriseus]|uniref:hypothetical protein n=1 Tax=Streptomyces luteogriseus TaxID=68233 RepID=UPI0033E92627